MAAAFVVGLGVLWWLWGAFMGWLAAAAFPALLEPASEAISRWSHARFGRPALELDSIRFHGELEPQGGQIYFEKGRPSQLPTGRGIEWDRWARRHDGLDVGEMVVRVNLFAATKASVLIDVPRIRITHSEILSGEVVTQGGVGGAAGLDPDVFLADLSGQPGPEVVCRYVNPVGATQSPPIARELAPGTYAVFLLVVRAHDARRYRWKAVIPYQADGRSKEAEVSDDGNDFAFVGYRAPVGAFQWEESPGDDAAAASDPWRPVTVWEPDGHWRDELPDWRAF